MPVIDETDDQGAAIAAALKRAELEGLPGSEWGRAVVARLTAVEAAAAELSPLTSLARAVRRRANVSLGVTGASLLAAVLSIAAWLEQRGEARSELRHERAALAAEREAIAAERIALGRRLEALDGRLNAVTTDLARLSGWVRGPGPNQ